MLEHALKINAKEQYQRIIASMIPHISKLDRQEIMNNYLRLMNDDITGEDVSSDIIKKDREQLRNLLNKYKNGRQSRLNLLRGKH
jgi:hypothetical protein